MEEIAVLNHLRFASKNTEILGNLGIYGVFSRKLRYLITLKNVSKYTEILGIRDIFRHFRRNYLYIKNHELRISFTRDIVLAEAGVASFSAKTKWR